MTRESVAVCSFAVCVFEDGLLQGLAAGLLDDLGGDAVGSAVLGG